MVGAESGVAGVEVVAVELRKKSRSGGGLTRRRLEKERDGGA